MKGGNWVLAATVVVIGALVGISSVRSQEAPRMSTQELSKLLGNPDVVVIDVRQEIDWMMSNAKIKGAVREKPTEMATWTDKYPKDKTLVFYCA